MALAKAAGARLGARGIRASNGSNGGHSPICKPARSQGASAGVATLGAGPRAGFGAAFAVSAVPSLLAVIMLLSIPETMRRAEP
jgi:hypothetical protein